MDHSELYKRLISAKAGTIMRIGSSMIQLGVYHPEPLGGKGCKECFLAEECSDNGYIECCSCNTRIDHEGVVFKELWKQDNDISNRN